MFFFLPQNLQSLIFDDFKKSWKFGIEDLWLFSGNWKRINENLTDLFLFKKNTYLHICTLHSIKHKYLFKGRNCQDIADFQDRNRPCCDGYCRNLDGDLRSPVNSPAYILHVPLSPDCNYCWCTDSDRIHPRCRFLRTLVFGYRVCIRNCCRWQVSGCFVARGEFGSLVDCIRRNTHYPWKFGADHWFGDCSPPCCNYSSRDCHHRVGHPRHGDIGNPPACSAARVRCGGDWGGPEWIQHWGGIRDIVDGLLQTSIRGDRILKDQKPRKQPSKQKIFPSFLDSKTTLKSTIFFPPYLYPPFSTSNLWVNKYPISVTFLDYNKVTRFCNSPRFGRSPIHCNRGLFVFRFPTK